MKKAFDEYKIGDLDSEGDKILEIVSRSTEVMVYFVKDGSLKIDASAEVPSERDLEIYREYDAVHSLIRRAVPAKYAAVCKKELGSMVFLALSDKQSRPISEYFSDLRRGIQERSTDYARFYYMFYGVSIGLLLLGVLCWLFLPLGGLQNVPALAIGTGGGIIGATVSILIRSNHLQVTPYSHWQFLAFQGATRALLGAFFGFIFIVAVLGDVLLSFLKGAPYGLLAFSVVAGFSEKYVPEILENMERQKDKRAETEKKEKRGESD